MIITSYDREHKLKLVKALAKHFSDIQLIVVTHDRGFYDYIRTLGFDPSKTQFKIIIAYSRKDGPDFAKYDCNDGEVEDCLSKDPPNINRARKAMEGWLRQICSDLKAFIPTPPPEDPEQIAKSDLVIGLRKAIKKIANYDKVNNAILKELQDGKIETLGSHFRFDETSSPSSGDALESWERFKEFRNLFICSAANCDGSRFMTDINGDNPVCKKCKTPLVFPTQKEEAA